MPQSSQTGTLYVVATPIGNLGDISQRARDVLAEVDLIAAEDTRHSKRLLAHLGIQGRLTSFHEHNEDRKQPELLARLEAGQDVALISDAGTPLVSDPGYHLIRGALEADLRVSPIPGPSALVAALSVAGLPSDRFCFEGFLPAQKGKRKKQLEALVNETGTLIFYESSHRIVDLARDLESMFPADREMTIARELTKRFETVHKTTCGEVVEWLESSIDQRKGEFVVLVRGASKKAAAGEVEADVLLEALLDHLPTKAAAEVASRVLKGKKRQYYQRALELAGKHQ